jgi:hypothetical protein
MGCLRKKILETFLEKLQEQKGEEMLQVVFSVL